VGTEKKKRGKGAGKVLVNPSGGKQGAIGLKKANGEGLFPVKTKGGEKGGGEKTSVEFTGRRKPLLGNPTKKKLKFRGDWAFYGRGGLSLLVSWT